jgi:type 2 lantibiotic biosynthesis protein LanM
MIPANTLSALETDAIVQRSSRLAERLSGEFIPDEADDTSARRRLTRWREIAAEGDNLRFADILASMGADRMPESGLLALLGRVQQSPGSALPAWASFLGEMVSAISISFAAPSDGVRPSGPSGHHQPIPYVDLYRPIVALARLRLQDAAGDPRSLLSEGAWSGLEGYLLRRLSAICSLALHSYFLAFKAVRDSGMASRIFGLIPDQGRGAKGRAVYQSFVKGQGVQGLAPFFLQHPTAARLSAEMTLLWIDFVGEFLLRLKADHEAIEERFSASQPLGKVTKIKAGASDPHHGGRTVLILAFAGSLRLVYKPRPMQIDLAFFAFARRLNAGGFKPALGTLAILDRSSHGWMEFARHASCRNRAEAKRYYRRAGALMCLAHVLRGVDCHRENMIAARDQPLIVDLEGLCHPTAPEDWQASLEGNPAWPIGDSVLRIGMLPLWRRRDGEDRYYNNSALSGPLRQRSAGAAICWKNINGDGMQAVCGDSYAFCRSHRPRLNGRMLSPREFLPDLVAGFRRMASLLTGRTLREETDACIARMNTLPARHIKRPTAAYVALLRHSLQPRLLIEGIDRSIELQALPPTGEGGRSRNAELAALEILDVPYFKKSGVEPEPATQQTGDRLEKAGLDLQVQAIEAAIMRRLVFQ